MDKPNFPDYTGGFDENAEEQKEEVTFEDLEDNFPEDIDEDAEKEEDETEEKEEKEIEEKEETEEGETEKEETEEEKIEEEEKKEPTDDDKIKENMLNFLKGEDGKGSTSVRVKGKEYDLQDLTPAEIKQWFSLGGRAYEVMEEGATRRKELDRREQTLNKGAETVNELLQRYGGDTKGKTDEASIPEGLRPSELDSDEVKALKEVAIQQNKDIVGLKQSSERATFTQAEQVLLGKIEKLKEEYSCGSPEEVIAVLSTGRNIPIRDIMEASHKNYTSDNFYEKIKEARPDLVRQDKERTIQEYLAKKGRTKRVARRTSSSTASSKVSEKSTKAPMTFEQIEARLPELKSMLKQQMDDEA